MGGNKDIMKINRVQITNYRNLKDIDVKMENITTLVGENNSGKSNFLHAVFLPLSSEDGFGSTKRLTWYDINNDAKDSYYAYLKNKRTDILSGLISVEDFSKQLPYVSVQLDIEAEEKEHYDIIDILANENDKWIGKILYKFYPDKTEEILSRVKSILSDETDSSNIKMSLLPVELYSYSITIPGKEKNISYEVLSRFKSVVLPAERDNFAANANKIGSKALSEILQKNLSYKSQVKIEKKYSDFFETVKQEGELEEILNWQEYSDIPNAKDFFGEISLLPNMPPISSILGSVRLGYKNESLFMQGLGHRNLILLTVMLNSYLKQDLDSSLRLITVEEPEAHLCNSNVLLMANLFNYFNLHNRHTQIVLSTHHVEFVNKFGLNTIIVFHNGTALNLSEELSVTEMDYLSKNPNTDIFSLFYSKRVILVEGVTEELLIKSYLLTNPDLNDIKVLSFHKGFKDIINIWKMINVGSSNKLGIVRDYDNQPNAQKEHEKENSNQVIVRTTKEYTLEPEIVKTGNNYTLLKAKYGKEFGWDSLNSKEMSDDWRNQKSFIMFRLCQDLASGELKGFEMPDHIQQIIDFMQGGINAN